MQAPRKPSKTQLSREAARAGNRRLNLTRRIPTNTNSAVKEKEERRKVADEA
jgi:hypothetical protein